MGTRVDVIWQVQDAKQRFSEVVRAAETGAPQVITRHGQQVAVVIDIATYHRLAGSRPDFASFLRSGPDFDDLDAGRPDDLTPVVDLESDG